jgi:uncharacterized protein (TIRG00374 family)
VWTLISGANPAYLAFSCVISSVALLLRSLRWRVLLRAEAPIEVSTAFWATAAGYFGNNFLPARAGELVRTFMISSRSALSSAYVLTTALAERVADAIVLVIISVVVLLTMPTLPGWLAGVSKPFAVAGFCGVLVLALLPRLERFGRAVIERIPIPQALKTKLTVILEHSLRGIRSFHNARRLFAFLGLTTTIWCLDASGVIVGAKALGLSIALPVAFLLIAGLGLGSALPATPGYVGIFQFVAVSVLTPFGFSRTNAIAYILLAQAFSYIVIGFWGALGFTQYRRMAAR